MLQGTQKVTVKGYEFELPTGHKAIAHKSINGIGWSVTLLESNFLLVHMVAKKVDAIYKAVEEAQKLGKEGLNNRIQSVR